MIESCAREDFPVLSETPIAPELPELERVLGMTKKGARIQVAEQYLLQPLHAARLKLIASGRLGAIHEADISVAHGYHGISLLRHYLDAGPRLPRITARKFVSRIVAGPGREGPPQKEAVVESERVIAQLDYGDRLGIYDFTGDQYFSWIRSPRVLVRGEKGEINQTQIQFLADFRTPIKFELVRRDAGQDGNLEGYSHRSISGWSEVLYENPFPKARFSDDEIAVATLLHKMKAYVVTGASFYGVAEACLDRHLDLCIAEAVSSGECIEVPDRFQV